MFVGSAEFSIRIPEAHSLKQKRAVLRSLTGLIKGKFDCAVAEVGQQDVWQRATIGVAVVAETHFHAERLLREIERHVESHPGSDLIAAVLDVAKPGE
ncbi:MAG TPA: DUF503 domain-containing protein [Actinomycetota bacterium]|nr:DUF503 domain-containing protein [Actinomycetota bacterium]